MEQAIRDSNVENTVWNNTMNTMPPTIPTNFPDGGGIINVDIQAEVDFQAHDSDQENPSSNLSLAPTESHDATITATVCTISPPKKLSACDNESTISNSSPKISTVGVEQEVTVEISFPLFQKFPTEIQLQIWKLAIKEASSGRFVLLHEKPKPVPPLLHVNRMCRSEALKVYTKFQRYQKRPEGEGIFEYVNLETDRLCYVPIPPNLRAYSYYRTQIFDRCVKKLVIGYTLLFWDLIYIISFGCKEVLTQYLALQKLTLVARDYVQFGNTISARDINGESWNTLMRYLVDAVKGFGIEANFDFITVIKESPWRQSSLIPENM